MQTLSFNRARDIAETPKTDPRIQRVIRIINLNKRNPGSLIQILHSVQDIFGYLPLGVIRLIAQELNVSPSRVFGVVTFYHYFSLKPKGEHTCLVCMGTACYVKGADRVLSAIEKGFSVKSGETTQDNKLGLQTARCIGACGLAPAVVIDNEIAAKVNPDQVVQMLKSKIG